MFYNRILLLFLLSVTSLRLSAAVVYTDIQDVSTTLNPNPGFADGIASIDFDNDGNEEYNFRWDDFGQAWFVHVTYANLDNFLQTNGNYNNFGAAYLEPIAANTTIDGSGLWENTGPEPLIGDDTDPNFQGNGDLYIGTQFDIGNNTYFGWILVSYDANKTLTIKSYAYEDTPNTAIIAGDTGSGTVSVASISVQGQGGASTIITQGGTLQMEAAILPANATNQTVTWSVSNGSGSATIDNAGLLTAVSDGTVTVTATANDGSGVSGDAVITLSNQAVGLAELTTNSFAVFPNPVVDKLRLRSRNGLEIRSVVIYSADGKVSNLEFPLNGPTNELEVGALPQGFYVLNITSRDSHVQNIPFIKQ